MKKEVSKKSQDKPAKESIFTQLEASEKAVNIVKITADDSAQRVDRWLRRHIGNIQQSQIEKLCRKGTIRLDGARVKASTRVYEGQNVRLPPLLNPSPAPSRQRPAMMLKDTFSFSIQQIEAMVIYKDPHILVLNKPAGLAVQGGSRVKDHIDGFKDLLRFDAQSAPKLVHRLDKATSGLLVMARTRKVAEICARAFKQGDVEKIYWACVKGRPSPQSGVVKFGLLKGNATYSTQRAMRIIDPVNIATTDGAKSAHTRYCVVEHFGERLSWMALCPLTGRTHQLRAHMAAIGHPIIGDDKYGERSKNDENDVNISKEMQTNKKLHLHAAQLHFAHPISAKSMVFNAPLDEHMRMTWNNFGWQVTPIKNPFRGR